MVFNLWNCCGLSYERLSYVKEDIGGDVTVLTELHMGDSSKWKWVEGDRLCVRSSAVSDSDPAAGVLMCLSPRAADCVISKGGEEYAGGRVVWARLAGELTNTFVIGAYVPHKSRRAPPFREDTLGQIDQCIRDNSKAGDVLVVMADFNGRLKRNMSGYTGKWGVHGSSDSTGQLVENIMKEHDLLAANTFFKPRSSFGKRAAGKVGWGMGNATYVMDKTGQNKRAPAQIDYILVSRRVLSSIQNCRVLWSPSRHRFGYIYDHGLVKMRLRQKMKTPQPTKSKIDWEVLVNATRRGMHESEWLRKFDATVRESLSQSKKEASSSEEDLDALTTAAEAAITLLPPRDRKFGKVRVRSEASMALFKEREERCREVEARSGRGSQEWIAMHRSFRKRICKSCREDYREWIKSLVEDVRVAEVAGRSAEIAAGVRKLAGSRGAGSRRPRKNPTTGVIYETPEELAQAWAEFGEAKFSCTPQEAERDSMPDLGPSRMREEDDPEDAHLEECLEGLRSSKAPGKDGIPVEIYQASPAAKEALFDLVKRIWKEEDLPAKLVTGVFCPLYKKKCMDDMENYRFICLLLHAYKLLSRYLLRRTATATKGFLPDEQAGFRAERGCRDQVFILSTLIDTMLEEGLPFVLVFIDFKAAFDSVSHKFLDEALMKACEKSEEGRKSGAKCRAIFRAIYRKANGVVRVTAEDGSEVLSRVFSIGRGVLQGDLFSPLDFIIAFAEIVKRHDCGGGVSLAEGLDIEILKYADDAVLIDENVEAASKRITKLCEMAWKEADMIISETKTEAMQPAREKVSPVKFREIMEMAKEGKFKFSCPHCKQPFPTLAGKKNHLRQCPALTREVHDKEYEVKEILDARGSPENRFYLVWWKGFLKKEDLKKGATWEPERHLKDAQDAITAWWALHPEKSKEETIEIKEEHRCPWCCKTSKTGGALKRHMQRCSEQPRGHRKMGDSLMRKAGTRFKRAKTHVSKPSVTMGANSLKNVFDFTYLGHFFQADGDSTRAVDIRIGKASARFTQLRNIWDSSVLSKRLKLQLYKSAVISTLSHCHEVWKLDKRIMKKIGGWNARCLSIITGNEIRDERIRPSVDVIKDMRMSRLRWLGHILRLDEDRLLRKVVLALAKRRIEGKPIPTGSILMDAPLHDSLEELVELAGDHGKGNHTEWQKVEADLDKHYVDHSWSKYGNAAGTGLYE